jgi:uncharacterized protein YlzI (FlbEa/FlbD family)
MIKLTKLNGDKITINLTQIMAIEKLGDTIVICNNGDRIRVQESPDAITTAALEWQQSSWLPMVNVPS